MTEKETIQYVENMDVLKKVEVYMNYYIRMIGLKYNFEVIDLEKPLSRHGMYKPDKEFKGIAFYYLWKDLNIKSFEEFCDKSNIQINDTKCDDWEEMGFASRSWTTFHTNSIYHYVYHSTFLN